MWQSGMAVATTERLLYRPEANGPANGRPTGARAWNAPQSPNAGSIGRCLAGGMMMPNEGTKGLSDGVPPALELFAASGSAEVHPETTLGSWSGSSTIVDVHVPSGGRRWNPRFAPMARQLVSWPEPVGGGANRGRLSFFRRFSGHILRWNRAGRCPAAREHHKGVESGTANAWARSMPGSSSSPADSASQGPRLFEIRCLADDHGFQGVRWLSSR